MTFRTIFASIVAAALAAMSVQAQPSGTSPLTPPENGPRVTDPGRHAIIGGTVHLPGGPETGVTILIQNGKIETIARGAGDLDLTGYRQWTLDDDAHIYPGFIDPWIEVKTPEHDRQALEPEDHTKPQRPRRRWARRGHRQVAPRTRVCSGGNRT